MRKIKWLKPAAYCLAAAAFLGVLCGRSREACAEARGQAEKYVLAEEAGGAAGGVRAAENAGAAGGGRAEKTALATAGIGSPAPLMYGIGSTSKVVAAAAVMRLADEGKIDLKGPLTTYIPEFEMADERFRKITPEMLLDHSSGLAGSTLNDAMLLGDNDTKNHDALLSMLKGQRLKAEPGELQVYCNDGFTLAEILVERVSGMSYTDYISREFAGRLGLESFQTPQTPGVMARLSPIYDKRTKRTLPPENANVIGSGGVYATAGDLCRFSEIFMRNRPKEAGLLSDEALKAMEASRYEEEINPEGYDTTLSYGLGWDSVETYPYSRYGIKALVKGGDTSFYHGSLAVLPEENISCAVLSSGGSSTLNQLAVQEIVMTYLEEVGRIRREEEESISGKPEETAAMPEGLTGRSGWYAGSDMMKVSISDNGTMSLSSKAAGRDRTQTYRYSADGGFYSTQGTYIAASGELSKGSGGRIGRTRLSFREGKEGETYLMAESMEVYPGLGRIAAYLPVGREFEAAECGAGALASWKELDGKEYYLVSEKYTSTAWLTRFMVKPLVPAEPEGILSFDELDLRMAAVKDDAHADFFTRVPGQAGRDLNDYVKLEEGGKRYLESYSSRYVAAGDVGGLSDRNCEITIGADGEAVWYLTGEANQKLPVTISAPQDGAWYVYDHTGRKMECMSSSWTMAEGTSFYLPKDGRVAFAGEAGAVFQINYGK